MIGLFVILTTKLKNIANILYTDLKIATYFYISNKYKDMFVYYIPGVTVILSIEI
jgi:hypothetical protein